tara:strand:- start:655 stop:1710 length:1056 start_codon:yes stop_codon:yes gene_type:complete
MSMQQMLLGIGAIKNDVHFAVTHRNSPYVSVYPFDNGFGTKISDPSTAIPGDGKSVQFSPDKKFIAITCQSSPYVHVYHWSNDGFGAKVADPSTALPGIPDDLRWSPDGTVIAFGANSSDGSVYAYAWSSSGFGSKYTGIPTSTSTISTVSAIRWSNDGNYILIGGNPKQAYGTRLEAYAWSNSTGFGTRYTPGTNPDDTVTSIHFHPDGDYVVVGQRGATTFCRTYPWSSSSQFGNNITAPAGKWNDDVQQVQFTAAGNDVAFGGAASPYVAVWPWTGSGYGTKYSNPSSLPSGFVYGLGIAPDDSAVAVGSTFGDKMQGYPFTSGTGLGTKYANPATLPAGNCRKADFA